MIGKQCTENCIDPVGYNFNVDPCENGKITSDCVIVGEDLNLSSLNVRTETSIKNIIIQIDSILNTVKDKSIELLYDNIVVEGSCISKQLITKGNEIFLKLSLDKSCLCDTIKSCAIDTTIKTPFIISATKYSICGIQKTSLTSIYNDTIWYDQNGIIIGNGNTKELSIGGNYYGVHNGAISNIINIIYNAECPTFTYTKIKNFYKSCTSPSVSTQYTYSRIYMSELSYQDALLKAESDSVTFDTQGQAVIDATGICIGENNPTPIASSCFNVFLYNVSCLPVVQLPPVSLPPVIVPSLPPTNPPILPPTLPPINPPIAPIRTDYWNLNFCSGGKASFQIDNPNLSVGDVVKDTVFKLCYVVVDRGSLVLPLLNSYLETHSTCAACLNVLVTPSTIIAAPPSAIQIVVPTTPLNTNVNVFVFAGESNAGTRNSASTLNAGESGFRAGVQIWNNDSGKLEQLNVGVNNYQGETATTPNGWGWEVELANLRANGTIKDDFIIVKTAQGGALIGNYNSNITDQVPNNFDMMVTRITGVKNALKALNKTPVFYIMYSQGINNAIYPNLNDPTNFPTVTGIAYWKAATKLYSDKLRIVTGATTKISYMKFFSPYGDYLNTTIQQIVDENPLNSFIETQGLGIQVDGLHFNASGTRSVADKYIAALAVVSTSVPNRSVPSATPAITLSVATNNTLVDMDIPFTTKWNYFDPDLIPTFQQAKYLDAKTGEYLANKWAIWHAPYRNLFGATQTEQLTKMFNKGWTAINASKIGGVFTGMENIITPDRMVVDGGLGLGNHVEDSTYDQFANFAKIPFDYANMYNMPKDANGKWRVFLSDIDYESKYSGMEGQTAINYHVVGFNSGLSITTGRYGFQYAGPVETGYITEDIYTGHANTGWSLPADSTVPAQYVGKKLSENNRFVGRTEVSYYYEEFLPQGFQVKDQNGNNWFKINHFGGVCYTGCGDQSTMNADNWAAHLGTLVETNYAITKANNQDFILQIKPVNERENGFKYSSIHPEYYSNKWNYDYKRYGSVYQDCCSVDPANGNCLQLCDQTNGIGSEYIPSFIAEAQVFLAYASGTRGINWWSSGFTDIAYPHDKTAVVVRSGQSYKDTQALNGDFDPYIYTMKALWRLNQKITLSDGSAYSFNEICDGTEVYLNALTKVIYPGSNTVTQLRAIDWQLSTKTPVRAVVNKAKNVVFVLAFQAYSGVEQSQVTFVLTDFGANISQVIDVPVGKVVMKAFLLVGNNSPVTQVVNSTPSVTLVVTPVVTPVVATNSNVVTTQPNRIANYYKSTSGNTEVISNYVLSVDDNVYLQNDKIKVGFSLRGGGAITYMSVANSILNIINNHDMGRQIQPDYYQSPNTFSVAGKQTSTNFPNNGYNTTLGGDDFKNSVTLKEYYPITNGYYVKLNPLIWGINGSVSEVTIEITYVLSGSTLSTTYKYTNNRTDSQIVTAIPNIVGQSIPAIYLNKFFTTIQTYDGSLPWKNGSITDRTIASTGNTDFNAKEKWTAISAPTKGLSLGVYSSILDYVRAGRKNIVNEIEVNDLDNACTLVEVLDSPSLPDSHNSWTRTDSVYYTLDTIDVIRAKAAQLSGNATTPIVAPIATPVITPVTVPIAIVSTNNNISNAIDCATKNLTITGNFIASNNFGMSLISGTTTLMGKDNIAPGNFNQVFINVPDGNYSIRLYEIGHDNNTFSSSVFVVNCASSPVSVPTSSIPVVNTSGGVTITVPNKLQYYFSDGHDPSYYDGNINMPAIHRSTLGNSNYTGRLVSNIFMQSNYSPMNDIVWLQNDKIKAGINLLRGGQLAWLSTLTATDNLIYNGRDGGFQVTIDAYQRQDGYTQNGKVSRKNFDASLQYNGTLNPSSNPLTSYNTCMGGDFNNNSQSLIAYYPITNGYVVKYRPLFYTFDIEFSQVTIEAKYTLQPGASAIRVDYTYHSFRTDSQFTGGGFDGAAAPSCFIVNTLNRGQTYAGNAPFTNAAIEDTQLPIENNGFTPFARNSTERFGCVYNNTTKKTFGIYIPSGRSSEFLRMKQLEVYVGNAPGTEFVGGFTHLDFFQDFDNPILDRSNYTKVISGYLIATDSPEAARAEAYRLKNLTGN